MMGMRNVFATLVLGLVIVYPAVQANENVVKGAFGFTFGEVLEAEGSQLQYVAPTGMRIFRIEQPPTPYAGLNTYTVQVTPERRIYEISGAGVLRSEAACIEERDFIVNVLADRYSTMARLESQDVLIRRTVLRLRDQMVEVLCIEADLSITYRDSSVLQPVESKPSDLPGIQAAPESGGRDTSGL